MVDAGHHSELRARYVPDGGRQGVLSHRLLCVCGLPRLCRQSGRGASGGPFRSRPAGPWSGVAGGGSGAVGRSCQPCAGAMVPYARGILRLQHVTFFHWCEPPMGASLSVHRDSVRLEGRNLFPAGLVHHRRCPWVPALPPGPSPARAVPSGAAWPQCRRTPCRRGLGYSPPRSS